MTDIYSLLLQYKSGLLPSDITVIYVPVKLHSAYGDFLIQGKREPLRPALPDEAREVITVVKYYVWGEYIYAGFGPQTKTLLIGDPVDNGSEG